MRARQTIIGTMLAALAVAGVRAQTPDAVVSPGQPGRAAITSADHRFMVSGMTSAENMVLAGQLADLARRIEEKTGMPLPMQRDQVLGVMVQSSAAPDQQVLKMQGWDDGRFYQRLVVPGSLRLDGEDLLEGACWLLLNRYAAEYTPTSQRSGMGATVPDWLSTGLAQNTQAGLKSRNRDWIARELAEGRLLPLAQVIKQEILPPGRWREKAYAAAAVEFLLSDGDLATWAALFKAAGTRQTVDAIWLRKNIPALRNKNPEAAWRAELEQRSRSRAIEAWSDHGLQLEEKLLQTLNFSPREVTAGIPNEVPPELYARDLIGYRNEAWARQVAAALSLQVQSLKLGAPPLLQEVLANYAAFFDQFAAPPAEKQAWWKLSKPESAKGGPPEDATWELGLNQLWQRAERAHQNFLERYQTRKRYVDSFDRSEGGELDETPAASDLPRTRIQKYMDWEEERRGRGSF